MFKILYIIDNLNNNQKLSVRKTNLSPNSITAANPILLEESGKKLSPVIDKLFLIFFSSLSLFLYIVSRYRNDQRKKK
jgi:hypothetical protein